MYQFILYHYGILFYKQKFLQEHKSLESWRSLILWMGFFCYKGSREKYRLHLLQVFNDPLAAALYKTSGMPTLFIKRFKTHD